MSCDLLRGADDDALCPALIAGPEPLPAPKESPSPKVLHLLSQHLWERCSCGCCLLMTVGDTTEHCWAERRKSNARDCICSTPLNATACIDLELSDNHGKSCVAFWWACAEAASFRSSLAAPVRASSLLSRPSKAPIKSLASCLRSPSAFL